MQLLWALLGRHIANEASKTDGSDRTALGVLGAVKEVLGWSQHKISYEVLSEIFKRGEVMKELSESKSKRTIKEMAKFTDAMRAWSSLNVPPIESCSLGFNHLIQKSLSVAASESEYQRAAQDAIRPSRQALEHLMNQSQVNGVYGIPMAIEIAIPSRTATTSTTLS